MGLRIVQRDSGGVELGLRVVQRERGGVELGVVQRDSGWVELGLGWCHGALRAKLTALRR